MARTAASPPALSLRLLLLPCLSRLSHARAHLSSPTQSACWPGPGLSVARPGKWPVSLQEGLPYLRGAFSNGQRVPTCLSTSFLPSSWLRSLLEAPQNVHAQSTWEAGSEAPTPSSAPSLGLAQPCYHLGYGNWLCLPQLWAPYSTASPSLDRRQVLG